MSLATVVICTHDREAMLGRAVEGAIVEARANDADVLVVDNASTDGTPALLRDLSRRHGPLLRVTGESTLGLSAARNRGLADSDAPVAALLDDDAVPRPGWLAALLRPYADPRVASVGGPIHLHFPTQPPPCLTPELHAAFSAFDLGETPLRLRYGERGVVE